jgi:hypothetical protein
MLTGVGIASLIILPTCQRLNVRHSTTRQGMSLSRAAAYLGHRRNKCPRRVRRHLTPTAAGRIGVLSSVFTSTVTSIPSSSSASPQ